MDWEAIAPMIVFVTLTLSVAGVLILRPLVKRLGDLIEITGRDRRAQVGGNDVERLTQVVGRLTDRLESLETRQEFAERLLTAQKEGSVEAQTSKREGL